MRRYARGVRICVKTDSYIAFTLESMEGFLSPLTLGPSILFDLTPCLGTPAPRGRRVFLPYTGNTELYIYIYILGIVTIL